MISHRPGFRALAAALPVLLLPAMPALASDWKPVEKIVTYKVTGATPLEIYQSVGHNAPVIGNGVTAMAHTGFRLTWRRDYRPEGGGCRLASARPTLTLTVTLPKLVGKPDAATARAWQRFRDGLLTHERRHGDLIVDLTRKIEAASVGLAAADDPDCTKVRAALQAKLGPLSKAERQASADLDRIALQPGGELYELVLAFVNSR